MQERWAREIKDAGVMTEEQMRDAKVPWPKTEEELLAYIKSLLDRPQSYGTCVYAMSMAATAAFYYASHVIGATGFQAGCADLDIIRRTRSIKGPFAIVNANDLIYPQYDILEQVAKYLEEWKPWAAEQARRQLAEYEDVVAHWRKLAAS